MKTILEDILQSRLLGERLLAVLIDPDKTHAKDLPDLLQAIHSSIVTHIFIGGSEVAAAKMKELASGLKVLTPLPVLLFPGDVTQITESADALLFLSLLSGRNPDYLITKQVEAVTHLRDSRLEIIPTGYLLIENGKETSVERISKTPPMPRTDVQKIVDTAKAGEYLGMKLMYLEAGSGALQPVSERIIAQVKQDLTIPLIVGGGIKNEAQLRAAYRSGADMVVIGTAFENDPEFFRALTETSTAKGWSSN